MSDYIVSARKYRPDSFETLVGQDNIGRTLKNSIQRGQLAHAYLFCGPRGVGKTSTARIFAKAINCAAPSADFEPCGKCESCISFAEGRSYCIHELDAASNNGVDDIKALMDQVRIPPQVGRYSVFIIDEVHMLSQSAFNAFLKTLEEPPAHAIFILCTTEKHKILPTILSRCQTYDFNRISVPDIVANLRSITSKEDVSIDDETLHVIARKADGAMRDALTIFDQTVAFCGTQVKYEDVLSNLNVLDYEYGFSLVDAALAGDYAKAFLILDEVLAKGFNAQYFISSVGEHLRDLLVSRTGGLEALLDFPDSLRLRYKEQASKCSVKFIYDALSITTACEAGYKAAANQRLHIEFALMKLCYIVGCPQPAAVPVSASPRQSAAAPASAPTLTLQSPAPQAPVTAPQTPAPARKPSALSLDAIMAEDEKENEASAKEVDAPVPTDEKMQEVWPKLSEPYENQPRLANMLRSAQPKFSEEDGVKVVAIPVVSEAQKQWIEEKLIHSLEDRLRMLALSPRLRLEIFVIPEGEQKKVVYMPEDRAKELMAENEEVSRLVYDLELDVK